MVPINYWAVLLNVVIAMGLGFAWYGPLFGKKWAALNGWSESEMQAKMQSDMKMNYGIQALGALLISFVLAHSLIFAAAYLQISGIMAGIEAAIWSWIGFVAPVTIGTVLWDGKPWKLWLINSGYYLVLLVAMGIVLALWP